MKCRRVCGRSTGRGPRLGGLSTAAPRKILNFTHCFK